MQRKLTVAGVFLYIQDYARMYSISIYNVENKGLIKGTKNNDGEARDLPRPPGPHLSKVLVVHTKFTSKQAQVNLRGRQRRFLQVSHLPRCVLIIHVY